MNSIENNYLLGNSDLYSRLCMVTEVLGKFVSSAPRAVTLAELERQTGYDSKELTKLCQTLCREELLKADPDQPQVWKLACASNQVTLEDAFRCAVAKQASRQRKSTAAPQAAPRREVDLLIMQASMGINQSIFQHLRQFSLDRLKVSATGMFPSRLSFS